MVDSPILSGDELAVIRSRVDAGNVDDLDVDALLDHIDAITDSYNDLVSRTAQHNDQVQVRMLELEEKGLAQADEIAVYRGVYRAVEKFVHEIDKAAPILSDYFRAATAQET